MVLPVRIELTTSALPRMRSTTELRQQHRLSGEAALCCRMALMSRQCETMAKHDEEREKRLAEALRANLRRRKAQTRGDEENVPSPSHPASPDGPLPLPEGRGEEEGE